MRRLLTVFLCFLLAGVLGSLAFAQGMLSLGGDIGTFSVLNGTSPATLRQYWTYTSPTNFQRLEIVPDPVGAAWYIRTMSGTAGGSPKSVYLIAGDGTAGHSWAVVKAGYVASTHLGYIGLETYDTAAGKRHGFLNVGTEPDEAALGTSPGWCVQVNTQCDGANAATGDFVPGNNNVSSLGTINRRLKTAYIGTQVVLGTTKPPAPLAGSLYMSGVPFASLGAPTDGTLVYCPDCVVASPCAAGGTGALAKRLAGAWVCN